MSEPIANVPPMDLRAVYLAYKPEFDAAVERVLDSGWYLLGGELKALEAAFAAYVGRDHAVGVANGTDAIKLALKACDIGPGDCVYTVAHTAVGTVSAIDDIGARPIFVDIDPARYTMDPQALEEAITSGRDRHGTTPRAVLPVNLYGQPADLRAIGEIARRHGLRLIEDCAQSHGAKLAGRMTGTFGELAAFSFYPTKNLGAFGDAGMIVCGDAGTAERLRALREYGWKRRYISDETGLNSRLDEIQAAILRVRLGHLEAETARRRAIAAMYDAGLGGTSITRPRRAADVEHAFHLYVVESDRRDQVRERLNADYRVATGIHYPVPVHMQPAYARFAPEIRLPHTEAASRRVISLPLYPQMTDGQVNQVVEACRRVE